MYIPPVALLAGAPSPNKLISYPAEDEVSRNKVSVPEGALRLPRRSLNKSIQLTPEKCLLIPDRLDAKL